MVVSIHPGPAFYCMYLPILIGYGMAIVTKTPLVNKVSEIFNEFNICAMLDLSCCALNRTMTLN